MSGSPATIEEAVALLNALPKPTSVACFVESLDRPLAMFVTNSAFSAQPALSTASPRVFLKLNRLWLSIVIDGDSSYLLEFGYQTEDLRSVKGELLLPLTEALSPSAPYDRVLHDPGTVCGLCHRNEQPDASVTFARAFTSVAFRPRPESYVSIDSLRREDERCDWQLEPHRCEMLAAVFDGGSVAEVPFPDSMATFF